MKYTKNYKLTNNLIKRFKVKRKNYKYVNYTDIPQKIKSELIHLCRKYSISIKILQWHPKTFIISEKDTYFPGYFFENSINSYIVLESNKFNSFNSSKNIFSKYNIIISSIFRYFNRKYGIDLITKQDFEEDYQCFDNEYYKEHYKKLY